MRDYNTPQPGRPTPGEILPTPRIKALPVALGVGTLVIALTAAVSTMMGQASPDSWLTSGSSAAMAGASDTTPDATPAPAAMASMPMTASNAPAGGATPTANAPTPGTAPTPAAATSAQKVSLAVNPPPLGGIKNPAGQVVDAFVPADFTVHAGTPVQVTVTNYDTMPHTWTNTGLGVNQMIPPGTTTSPSHVTFTFTPTTTGTYHWTCETPCDPWSMTHTGYMQGDVTVVS